MNKINFVPNIKYEKLMDSVINPSMYTSCAQAFVAIIIIYL